MARGTYSHGKREREAQKARKKQEKQERRREKRERGPGEVEVTTAEEVMGFMPSVDEAMRAIERGATAPRAAAPIPSRLFVGGLSDSTTAADLRAAFSEYGPVADAIIVTDRETGSSRGFGFVTMENRKDAPRAIAGLSDTVLNGRTIVVNAATERQR